MENILYPLHYAAKRDDIVSLLKSIKGNFDLNGLNQDQETPLLVAARHGKLKIVQMLVEKGANCKIRDKYGNSPIHCAAAAGHRLVLGYLLDINKEMSVDCRNSDEETPLHLAARNGQISVLHELMRRGADCFAVNEKGRSPLHIAAMEGQTRVISALKRKRNVNVNVVDKKGNTPLHLASDVKTVNLLDKNGADCNAVNTSGSTPLHHAANNGQTDIMLYLLDRKKVNVDPVTKTGHTPLHLAAVWSDFDTVKLLVERGADCNAFTKAGCTPLHSAATANHGQTDIMLCLIDEKKVNVNAVDNEGNTPLHTAVCWSTLEAVQLLIKKGAIHNVANKSGCTPLHFAAQREQSDILSYLIQVNLSTANSEGATPLHLAALWSNVQNVKLLIESGADCNATDESGCTPLHLAAEKGQNEIISYLIDVKKVDVNARNTDGNTPLHVAAGFNNLETVKLLVDKGADYNAVNDSGLTPLSFAVEKDLEDIVMYLIELVDLSPEYACGIPVLHLALKYSNFETFLPLIKKGADWKATDQNGSSLLHCAAEKNHLDILRYLIDEKKMDVNSLNNARDTPLHYASRFGNLEAVKMLVEKGADCMMINNLMKTPMHEAAKYGHNQIVTFLLTN